MSELDRTKILFLVGDDYEDLELWYPLLRLQEAGAATTVAGQKAATTYRGKHGYPCTSDAAIADMRGDAFDGIFVPGGWMPDKLRRDPQVLALARHFAETGKLVATICHGPWILISAGVCRGVRMTSTPGIRDDVTNAGASWVDEPVVVDRNFISSRRPPDLPAMSARLIEWLKRRGEKAVNEGG
jgi:protease I